MKLGLLTGALAGSLVVGFILAPNPAFAQEENGLRTPEQLVIDVDQSERLFGEASRLEGDYWDSWGRARVAGSAPRNASRKLVEAAAERYVESAELRPYGDAQAYLALYRAGVCFFYADKTTASSHAFAAAAERGLETGQVYEAAMAFVSAAEQGQEDPSEMRRVLDYLRTAHELSESPALTHEQRQRVRQRMGLDGV